MFALALGASPVLAAGSPLTRFSMPADTLGSLCGYQFTSGVLNETFRTADAVIDPETGEYLYIPAAHMTLRDVVAERGGASFKVVGVEIYNDLKGHLTAKLTFISQGGGVVDNINIVLRVDSNGDIHVVHDFGTCSFF